MATPRLNSEDETLSDRTRFQYGKWEAACDAFNNDDNSAFLICNELLSYPDIAPILKIKCHWMMSQSTANFTWHAQEAKRLCQLAIARFPNEEQLKVLEKDIEQAIEDARLDSDQESNPIDPHATTTGEETHLRSSDNPDPTPAAAPSSPSTSAHPGAST